ncbi:MAG TPA: response regulator [Ferruginibacter sp.]|jgi:FixJ family two-component response regulator|nr:response regulator [Ferruginibacter sp.]
MEGKLKCVIIDDDPAVHTVIKEFLRSSDKAVITQCFERCSDFLNRIDKISYDLVLLDCLFPNDIINGVEVAFRLKELGKEFIFISAKHHSFIDACRLIGALDAMPKPLTEKRFKESIDKSYKFLNTPNLQIQKHVLFNVKELKRHVNIYIPEVLYMRTHHTDPRNKLVRLNGNVSYTLMDCKFQDMLKLSADLVMANKSELISYNIMEGIKGGDILLNQSGNNKIPKSIPLSPHFKNNFKMQFH